MHYTLATPPGEVGFLEDIVPIETLHDILEVMDRLDEWTISKTGPNLPRHGDRALHAAIILGHIDTAVKLIENGADPTAKNRDNICPLSLCHILDNQEGANRIRSKIAPDYEIAHVSIDTSEHYFTALFPIQFNYSK